MKKALTFEVKAFSYGAPDGNRTHNLLIRNQMRYPIAPRARNEHMLYYHDMV